MPLDEIGEGCVKVLFRFLIEFLLEGLARLIWRSCQVTGASVVWVVTFGRIRMLDAHEHWAGVIGLLFTIALMMWLLRGGGS